jgi:hypothetical protein
MIKELSAIEFSKQILSVYELHTFRKLHHRFKNLKFDSETKFPFLKQKMPFQNLESSFRKVQMPFPKLDIQRQKPKMLAASVIVICLLYF